MRSNGLVQSISRSLDIIEHICQSPDGMGVTQLASQLGLAKTTTHRILRALLERGYVYQDPWSGAYGPGTKMLELAGVLRGSMAPQQKIGPLVRDLKRRSGEHAYFAAIAPDRQCIVVCNEESAAGKDVLVGSSLGKRFPLHADPARIAYIGQLSDYERRAVMRNLGEQLNRREVTRIEKSFTQPQDDFYVSSDSMGQGITSIATVAKDHSGYAVGILGVLVPSFRINESTAAELGSTVAEAAGRISLALGYHLDAGAAPDAEGSAAEEPPDDAPSS